MQPSTAAELRLTEFREAATGKGEFDFTVMHRLWNQTDLVSNPGSICWSAM